MTTLIDLVELDDDRAADPSAVGGKAAALHRLRRAGLDVPDGVVVAVADPKGRTDGLPPDLLHRAARRAIARFGDVPLAVRSSARGEDGVSASRAGAYRTVLGATGADEVAAAIATVRGSGPAGASDDVAVLVQPLLAPTAAGVAFTADPLTGDREVVRVAAVRGLGERLVSGEEAGEEWTVPSTGGDPQRTAPDGDGEPVLSAHDARAVARVARDAAVGQPRPQDVEWALVDGRVVVLQSRPMTVVPTPPTATLDGGGWSKDLAHNPEPVTTFGWSFAQRFPADPMGAIAADFGLLIERTETRNVGGEVYFRVVPVGAGDGSKPPPFEPPAWLLGVVARLAPPLRRRTAAAREMFATGLLDRTVRRWTDEWRPAFEQRIERVSAVDLATLDDASLAAFLDELVEGWTDAGEIHFRLFIPYVHALHELAMAARAALGWDDAHTIRLMSGCSPASVGGETALAELRARVAATPGATDALRASPSDPIAALASVDADLSAALEDWIARHAWRPAGYDAGAPAMAERPALVTSTLLDGGTGHASAAAVAEDAEAEAREALADASPADRAQFVRALAEARRIYPLREENLALLDGLPSGQARRWLVEVARRLVERGLLEDAGDAVHLAADELQEALRGTPPPDLVDRLVRRRDERAWVLANPGPVEVGASAGAPPDLRYLPAPLRRANEPLLWMIAHEFPEMAGAEAGGAPAEAPGDATSLRGVPASPGTHTGPVRLVHTAADLDRVQPGDVVVCPIAPPTWTLVFPIIGALIADGGGAMSHTAIVAREHGLPAVLGTGSATSVLEEGERVTVDGTNGIVRRVAATT